MANNDKPASPEKEKLHAVSLFLEKHSLFPSDTLKWASNCINNYLNNTSPSLDHAFGLKSSKRGPKHGKNHTHEDWVANAWLEVIEKIPSGKDWPSTKELAKIGRYYGLGGKNPEDADDHAIASNLKQILRRYRVVINNQIAEMVHREWNDD